MSDRHPGYWPCDAFGHNGTCSECTGAISKRGMTDTEVLALLEPNLTACREDLARCREIVARLEKERDEAKRHLDGRIQWQLEAVLHLQTFRALFDAAVLMRDGHEGCITDPACGDCFRCDFDKAVDQAKEEVRVGVDSFIEESAGFWGRFAAKMQKERDAALSDRDSLKARLESVKGVYEAAVQWRKTRDNPFTMEGTREHRQDCFALQAAIDTAIAARKEKP